ncbi:hypothetical protein ABK040_013929 [Willaertia magna]
MTYGDLQNFEKAIDYFLKAFDLQKKQDDCKLYYLGMCYNNIGWCYKHLNNDYSKAIEVSGGDSVDIITEGIGNCSEGLSDLFQMRSNVYDVLNDSLNKDADIVKTLQIKRGLFERMG